MRSVRDGGAMRSEWRRKEEDGENGGGKGKNGEGRMVVMRDG